MAAPLLLLLLVAATQSAWGQVETLPATHPVYDFLRRMEVRGLLHRYRDAILPLPRGTVARLLGEVAARDSVLSATEREVLRDFDAEFRFDRTGDVAQVHSLVPSDVPGMSSGFAGIFTDRERFLFGYRDSVASLFVNGLLTGDARAIWGDALGNEQSTFLQFGVRLRGTIGRHLGFYLQATNAQFWGSRELLARDRLISQSYALGTLDAQNFDFVDASVRFNAGIISAEVARERLLWGYGVNERMIFSDNVRTYDFIRADVEHGAFRYTFVHAWLLGRRSSIAFAVPPDTAARFVEPVVADKYAAAHRLELSFPSVLEAGAQEMVVYSNRSVDLAYLTPLTLIESAQRAREERDNVMWAFDLQTLFIPGLQLHGTAFFDDLHLAEFFSDSWYNRYAWQAGLLLTDPLGVHNLTLMGEYTRVEPWVYSHNRSRDNDYGSLGRTLGPRIGPNADSWFGRADVQALRNLRLSIRVERVRQGRNPVDSTGALVRNVGGDILQPHADTDSPTKTFLDGVLATSTRIELRGLWEIFHQLWMEGMYLYEDTRGGNPGEAGTNRTVQIALRLEL